jgi:MFS family permease
MTPPSAVPAAGTTAPDGATADPRRWRALAVLLLVQFMIILDVSVVNIALPTIQSDLGFSRSGLTWVVDGYVLVAGSLLLLGGRLGDVLGRRRMFLVGVVVFGVASLACGLAQDPGTLVASRIAQGVGEALAAPAAFGLIALMFTDVRERAKAIGLFGGISGLAGTSGPIVSGALVEYSTWRWIFFINLPVVLLALVLVPRLVRRDLDRREAGPRRLDLPGAALVTVGLFGIVYGVIEAAAEPWGSAHVLVPMLGGFALVGLFVVSQTRVRDPLLPLRFLRERTRVGANLTTLLFSSVFFSQFFVTTLYLQDVLEFGPLRTGLGFLPFGIAVGAALGLATSLIPRLGVRPVLVSGLLSARSERCCSPASPPTAATSRRCCRRASCWRSGPGCACPRSATAPSTGSPTTTRGSRPGLQQALQQIGGAGRPRRAHHAGAAQDRGRRGGGHVARGRRHRRVRPRSAGGDGGAARRGRRRGAGGRQGRRP